EETGKLEEPQTPEMSPERTTTEPDENVEDVIIQTDVNDEDVVTAETDNEVEEPAPVEDAVPDPDEKVEDVTAQTDEKVEEAAVEADGKAEDAAVEADEKVEEAAVEADGKVEEAVVEADEKVEDAAVETDGKVEEAAVEAGEKVEEAAVEADEEAEEAAVEADEKVEEAAVEADEEAETVTPTETDVENTASEPDEKVEEVAVNDREEDLQQEKDAGKEAVSGEETVTPLDTVVLAAITKPEIIEQLKQIVAEPRMYMRNEADVLKQTYYKIRRAEVEEKKKEFLDGGGEERNFVMEEDETESIVKSLVSEYKEKRASIIAEEERQKEANYVIKQHLIERLKVLTESQDDFNKRYNEFREIQRKWKEIKLFPQEHAKELWRNYQLYNERFYDIVKINNQFREYDFKKNLEMKTTLCEAAERLDGEPDILLAFRQLQKVHQQWRETGPVAREFRDSIWERFKEASTAINRKHQVHFENLKANEEKNFGEKVAICEKIEGIDFESLKTLRDWEKKTEEMVAMRAKWRTIGYANRKQNIKIFERFRKACDRYFTRKNEFYKSFKQELDKNLELKRALIEKAESMKDRTDWKDATKAFIEIQGEWKKIGPTGHKYSESIWKQFIMICDYFFEQRNKEASSQRSGENENLEAKKALIEKINAIDESVTDEDALAVLREYIADWNTIGFVPFREKDKLYKSFREAVDKQFDRMKVNVRDRRVQQFRSNLTELAGGGKNKLYNERDKLMRVYERMKSELQTYENNIGFFNISSKGGDGLMKEMDRKLVRLKEEMEVIVKKIEAIDENLD
ncbi:MAG: DUF349 domain-containing protein, partial [Tannerella sp.]|nr:DUF349 domain-containing protein [Tannerella sp.]